MELKKMTKFCQFAVQVFINRIESFLELFIREFTHGIVGRVVVDVRKQDGLRECRFDVFPRATVAVAAGTDL